MRQLFGVALLVAFAAWPVAAMAHEGHDHGAKQGTKNIKKVKKPAKHRSLLEQPGIRTMATPTV